MGDKSFTRLAIGGGIIAGVLYLAGLAGVIYVGYLIVMALKKYIVA